MVGYNCKYVPLEIIKCFEEPVLLNNTVSDFNYSSNVLHPNMCSHIKALVEDINKNDYDKLFLVNCCDSARRFRDCLRFENISYVKMLDIPIGTGDCSVLKLKNDLLNFITELEKTYNKKFNKEMFLKAFEKNKNQPNENFIALMGARSNRDVLSACEKSFSLPIIDFTCAENRRVVSDGMSVEDSLEMLMEKYAKALLTQFPCMRMADISSRKQLLNNPYCKGVVYHTIKFCDYYDYEYTKLQNSGLPIIKIETDFTKSSSGQISTRLEGFAESIKRSDKIKMNINKNGKYFAGIDSGSTSTEIVVIDKNKNIISKAMVRTGANASDGAKKALSCVNMKMDDFISITATGYGRKNIEFANCDVTEITCHAKGAKFLYNDANFIIDIGGQDSKVISLDSKGNIANFVMNDKCAAGTGRFLENMAKVLEINMEQMVEMGTHYKNDLTISSMCTVFAESEVISLIAENKSIADIIHGLNKSVAVKTKALAYKLVGQKGVMMTGGVANNNGVVSELQKQLNTEIFVPENPEFCGALGAALIALENSY